MTGVKKLSRGGIFLVVAVAAVMRLWVWTIDPLSAPLTDDSRQYQSLACNVVEHGVYSTDRESPWLPSARRTPAYPLFLATVYTACRSCDHRIAELVGACLGVLLCVFTSSMALRISGNPAIAMVAGMMTAISPPLVLYSVSIGLEALFPIVLVGCVAAVYRWVDRPDAKWAIIAGALFGLLALTKPESALLPVFVAPVLLVLTKKDQSRWRGLCLAGVTMALVISPWLVRNRIVTGKWKLQHGRSNEGIGDGIGIVRMYRLMAENDFTFWPKRYPFWYGDKWKSEEERFQAVMDGPVKNPEEGDVAFWLQRPHLFAKYSATRLVGLCLPASWSATFGLDKDFSELSGAQSLLLLSAKAGLLALDVGTLVLTGLGIAWSLFPRNCRTWIVTGTLIYFVMMYSLLHGIPRYRVPLLPLGFILGGMAVHAFWTRYRVTRVACATLERRDDHGEGMV